MAEKWVVVVTVNDEPPKPPVITGVFGPYSEQEAEDWASSQLPKPNTTLTVIPLTN